jgi:hypothetical protein
MANCTKDIATLLEDMCSQILLCTEIHWLYGMKFVIYPFVLQVDVWNLLFNQICNSHIALILAKWLHIFGKVSQLNRLILNFASSHKWVHHKKQKMLWSINYICLLGDWINPNRHYCHVFWICHVKCSYQTELMWMKLTVASLTSAASWVQVHTA